MGRKIGYAVVLATALIPALCGRAYGQKDPKPTQLPAYYHPLICWDKRKHPTSGLDSRRCRSRSPKDPLHTLPARWGKTTSPNG